MGNEQGKRSMSKFYKIPCVWQMYGYHEVEANSLSEAIDLVLSDDVGLPDGEYLETSFEVDTAIVEDINKEQL
jgi:hypothetical protein